MELLDINKALFLAMEYRNRKQEELSVVLDISPAAVSKKKIQAKWAQNDIKKISDWLKLDVMRLAMDIAAGEEPVKALKSQIDGQGPTDLHVVFNAEELKQLLLNNSRTVENLQIQLDNLRQEFRNLSMSKDK